MDQLKQAFAAAAKQQFWIVTTIATVLGIVGFFMASSQLSKLYTEQKTTIDSHFSNMNTVNSAISTHPNQQSYDQMQLIIGSMAEDVQAAWESQWERQAPILKWPTDIPVPGLIKKLEGLYPIELELEYPEEPANIVDSEKRAYSSYFDLQMPRLAKIIGVTWRGEARAAAGGGMGMGGMPGMGMGGMPGMGMGEEGGYGGGEMGGYGGGMEGMGGYGGGEMGGYGGGMGGMGGMGGYGGMGGGYGMSGGATPSGERDVVIWPKSSQDELLTSIRMWRGPLPNVYEMVYTQENMWLLEGLLNIIKRTNGNAIANFQTTVREIEFIRIGRTAVGNAGVISGVGGTGGGMGMGGMGTAGMEGGMEGMYGEGYGGMEMGEGEGSGEGKGGLGAPSEGGAPAVTSDPADGRYVDANFSPITGEDLRTRMKSEDPADAYFAVAKRVPVRLRLRVDQRKVHNLLANCGNAALMLEVHQVRLGDTAQGGGAAGGYGGGMGMGGMGMPGMEGGGMPGGGEMGGYGGEGDGKGMGGEGMGGYGGGMGGYGGGMGGYGGMTGGSRVTKEPWLITIEIYGVVTLFNPVDINRLGLDKVTEETELDSTVDNPAVVEPTAASPAAEGDAQPAPADGQPAGGQPAGGQPAGTPPSDGQPAGGSAGDMNGQPAGGQPAANGQPTGGQPAGS